MRAPRFEINSWMGWFAFLLGCVVGAAIVELVIRPRFFN